MMNRLLRLACLCSALLGPGLLALPAWSAEAVRVATTELPPFAMENVPDAPGALHEIVQELLRRTAVPGRIEFVPWRRAMLLASTQRRTVIFPLSRTPEREPQFRWLARLYQERFVFLSTQGRAFDVAAPQAHKQARIGVLRGSIVTVALRELGYTNIVEAASVDEELRFLERGIVDAVFGEAAIFQHVLKGRIAASYFLSAPQSTTVTWLGASLDLTEAEAALFAKARRDMVDDGSYARILKKYGLPPAP